MYVVGVRPDVDVSSSYPHITSCTLPSCTPLSRVKTPETVFKTKGQTRHKSVTVTFLSSHLVFALQAKKVAGRTKHRDPVADGFLELNVRTLTEQQQSRSPSACVQLRLGLESTSSPSSPLRKDDRDDDSKDLWSPSSNEDNTSPTELNRRFADKPAPVKKLEDSWQRVDDHDLTSGGTKREDVTSGAVASESSSGDKDEAGAYACGSCSDVRRSCTPRGKRSPSRSPRTVPRGRAGHRAVVTFPPAPPERHDSLNLNEEEELREAPWFQAGIPR